MPNGQVRNGYKVYKVVDDIGMAQRVHADNPTADLVFRYYIPDPVQDEMLRQMVTDVPGVYVRWRAMVDGAIRALPYARFESLNECGAPDHYLAFEKYRVDQLAKENIKACVINIGCAHSDRAMWERAVRIGLIAACVKHDAWIGEHSYGQTVMSANCGSSYWDESGQWHGELFPRNVDPASCHTSLRIKNSKKILAELGYPGVHLFASELGWDNLTSVYAPSPRTEGYHNCVPHWLRMGWCAPGQEAEFARKQLDWWCAESGCDGVIYTVGTGGNARWDNFNVSGVM